MSIALDPITMQTLAALGQLSGTLQGNDTQGSLAGLQATQQDQLNQMAQQSANAAQQAQQAGTELQQAAQTPAPEIDPFQQLLTTLGGNVASTLSQNPTYRQQAQQSLQEKQKAIQTQRETNLDALSKIYSQRADVAQHLGDLATAEKYRQNHEKLQLKIQELNDQQRHENAMAEINARNAGRAAGGSGGASGLAPEEIQRIVTGIKNGTIPAKSQGYYRNWGHIVAELQKQGFDYNQANRDQIATEKFLSSGNSPPQLRIRQAIENVSGTLKKYEALNAELKDAVPRTLWPAVNAASLAAARNGAGVLKGVLNAQKAQSLATRFNGLANDLTAEMGYVYMGGNSPTDHALKLAATNLSQNWDPQTIDDNIQQARDLLDVRKTSITAIGPLVTNKSGGSTATGSSEPTTPKTAKPSKADQDYVDSLGGGSGQVPH